MILVSSGSFLFPLGHKVLGREKKKKAEPISIYIQLLFSSLREMIYYRINCDKGKIM